MTTASKPDRRIPSLDGIRAVAMLGVLYAHSIGTQGFPVLRPHAPNIGELGLRTFFVLSGFLITGMLLGELRTSGTISLKEFYIRRSLRIFPAFYVFLAIVAILSWLGLAGISVPGHELWRAAIYTTNYFDPRTWEVGHLWSLAVEEQFYLTWPLTLLILGARRGAWLAFGTMLLVPLIRIAFMALPDGTLPMQRYSGMSFETVVDGIACGTLLALIRDQLWANRLYRGIVEARWFWALPLLAVAADTLPHWGSWLLPEYGRVFSGLRALVGISLVNIAAAMMIDRLVRFSDSPAGRFLNLPRVAWFGSMTYSMYLWQQVFLNRDSDHWTASSPINVVFAVSVGILSHYVVERPIQRLRSRFKAPTPAPSP